MRMQLILLIACTRIFFSDSVENPFGPDVPRGRLEFDELIAGNMISSSILNEAVTQFASRVSEALEIQDFPGFHIYSTQETEAILESFSTSSVGFTFLLVSQNALSHVISFSHRFIQQFVSQ